jgi:hypothetical protein
MASYADHRGCLRVPASKIKVVKAEKLYHCSILSR